MHFYRLTNFLFRKYLAPNLLLCLGLLVLTPTLCCVVVGWSHANPAYGVLPYESLLAVSGVQYVFIGALLLQALLIGTRYFADYIVSGGLDMLLLLPMKRREVLLAFCAAGVISVLLLFAAQALALVYTYPLAVAASERAMAAHPDIPYTTARTNGLFLAMLRCGLFRVVLPATWFEGLHTAVMILLLGSLPALALFPARKRLNYMLAVAVYTAMIAAALYFHYRLCAAYGENLWRWLFLCSVYPLSSALGVMVRTLRELKEGGKKV